MKRMALIVWGATVLVVSLQAMQPEAGGETSTLKKKEAKKWLGSWRKLNMQKERRKSILLPSFLLSNPQKLTVDLERECQEATKDFESAIEHNEELAQLYNRMRCTENMLHAQLAKEKEQDSYKEVLARLDKLSTNDKGTL